MNQQILNTLKLANYSGKNHVLITRSKAEELLSNTDYRDDRTMKHGIPDKTYPENYFFTLSSFEHVEAHIKCRTPFSVNAFFINDDKDSHHLLVSYPIPESVLNKNNFPFS